MDDPAGHYAALGVDPAATSEAITAAYRRKARMLHPDIPGTGDAAAFIRVQQAYEVLGDAARRAAYDRARGAARTDLPPPPAEPAWHFLHLDDRPVALWAGLGALCCLAAGIAVVRLSRHEAAAPVTVTPATPVPAPLSFAVPTADGPATHYVLPSAADAILWRHDAARDAYLPAGHIAAFAAVRALGLVRQHGLVEIPLADGSTGFIDAVRLEPGDRAAARRAYCAYNAGVPPTNGEILDRHGAGAARLEISNHGPLPAVVRLRDAEGRAAVTVFVSPGDRTTVDNVPDSAYRPDFAIGELWSRACNGFAAGMRAQRFAFYASPAGLSPLVIPPELSVAPAPVDIPDTAFEEE
jgi:hypothetical protein